MSALYRDAKTGRTLQFVGRARVEDDATARRQIFDKSPVAREAGVGGNQIPLDAALVPLGRPPSRI